MVITNFNKLIGQLFLLGFVFVAHYSFAQKIEIPKTTLEYIQRAADGDHLALEGGHLALDGHVMPYPFFEAHETLYLYRLSQLRHQVIWKADSMYYKPDWDDHNPLKTSHTSQGTKISVNKLNGGRHTRESYWLELPPLPKSKTGYERFFTLKPIEMTLPGWPETTIYVNGKSKAALMRQHFYWSLDQLLDDTKPNAICLKSFGIYDQKRGYKDVSVVERDPQIDELYWYMRVLIEAKSILKEDDKGFVEIKTLSDEIMSTLDLDIAETSLFKDQIFNYLPIIRTKFKAIEALSDSTFELNMLNHGHLDSAWRWTLDHTDEKIERLVLNNLYLMDRYPEYQYIFTTPYHYERIEKLYPGLFKRVQEKIKNGQWIADGSTYVETDMNLPGNESIVRQFLYGLDYYRNTLGVKNNSLFLPDTFGYPRFLPQIAQGFGLDHLVAMRVNTPAIDHTIYRWKGIDGTEILVNGLSTPAWEYPFVDAVHNYAIKNPEHYTTYNAPDPGPRRLLGTYNQFKDKMATQNQLMLIGWGDGGGGGTEDQIELKRKVSSLPSFPKVKWTNMYDYITNQKKHLNKFTTFDQRIIPARFVQRTFISANGVKTINRAVEQRLRETEALSVMAGQIGYRYPHDKLEQLWKTVLLHHFHDIITGMAVPEVLSEAYITLKQTELETAILRNKALDYLLNQVNMASDGIVIFNPSGVLLTGVIELPNIKIDKNRVLVDANGNEIVYDVHDEKLYIDIADFEAMSFKTLFWKDKGKALNKSKTLSAKANVLENTLVKVTFNKVGEITSYYDKIEHRELVPEQQTWNNFIELTAQGDVSKGEEVFNKKAKVTLSKPTSNVLKASLELDILYKSSKIKQVISLKKGSKQLSFNTKIDWREPKRLEVDFPLKFASNTANHGIQWGYHNVERSRFKAADSLKMPVCVHQWADVSDNDYGLAIFDNVRYGYDLKKGGIRLILSYGHRKQSYEELKKLEYTVKGSGDWGGENFSYAIFPHTGGLSEGRVIQNAKAFNTTVIAQPLAVQKGKLVLDQIISGLPNNIILQTIKQSEDQKGIVVRLYETEQKQTAVNLNIHLQNNEIYETNLNEEVLNKLQIKDNTVKLEFKPFEIKTICVK